MTEAAIALPVIILAAMLLVRMFVFYIEILTTGINEHEQALKMQDSYSGMTIRTYETGTEVVLLKGGLLRKSAGKQIDVKTYLINEDFLVRSGEALD